MAIFLGVSAAPERILLSKISYSPVQNSLSQPESFIVAGDDLLGAAPVPPGRGGRAAGHEEAPRQQQQQPPAPAALPATAGGQVRAAV